MYPTELAEFEQNSRILTNRLSSWVPVQCGRITRSDYKFTICLYFISFIAASSAPDAPSEEVRFMSPVKEIKGPEDIKRWQDSQVNLFLVHSNCVHCSNSGYLSGITWELRFISCRHLSLSAIQKWIACPFTQPLSRLILSIFSHVLHGYLNLNLNLNLFFIFHISHNRKTYTKRIRELIQLIV